MVEYINRSWFLNAIKCFTRKVDIFIARNSKACVNTNRMIFMILELFPAFTYDDFINNVKQAFT